MRLRTLVSIGAIALRARGHRGTFVLERDLAELWSVARLGPVRGILPLPEALEPVTLAAVLRQEFERLKIPLELLYLHGSQRRIEMVRTGNAHFAVSSQTAAAQATSPDAHRWVTYPFGPETYHRDDSMVVLLRPHLGADDTIAHIGIDPESADHTVLTRAEFPAAHGYAYSEHPHGRLPAAVTEGVIDAAVWHRTALAIPLTAVGIVVRPLHRPEAIAISHALGHAVLVVQGDQPEVISVLDAVDVSGTRQLQEEIRLSGVLPLY